MKTYAVTYRDSKAKQHIEFVNAESAEAADEAIPRVTIKGLGGDFVTCVEVLKVERMTEEA